MPQELVNPELEKHGFNTTEWTAVLAAANRSEPGSFEALQRLCESYWYPIFAYLRRWGKPEEEAKDLTQGFFAHLIERGMKLDRGRDGGRFRSFLLRALKNFTVNEWKKSQRQRRGGEFEIVSLTQGDPEALYEQEIEVDLSPERLFERKWAKALMARVASALEAEYRAAGKLERFRVMAPWLAGFELEQQYGVAAMDLGVSESTVRGAVRRLRARYRELFREEVKTLVEDPADVDSEMQHILELLLE